MRARREIEIYYAVSPINSEGDYRHVDTVFQATTLAGELLNQERPPHQVTIRRITSEVRRGSESAKAASPAA